VSNDETAASSESVIQDQKDTTETDRQDAFLFIRKKQDYYFTKWKKVNTWNWAAFFLAPFWLGYRKMYQYLFLLFGAYFAIDAILITLLPSLYESLGNSISLGAAAFFGIQGNDLYKKHMLKKIAKIESGSKDDNERLRRIEIAGGTSGWGVLCSFAVIITYAILIVSIFE